MNKWQETVAAKSDQLNADDLLASSIVIVVTQVTKVNGDQPMVINYQNDNGKPYKPNKTMRKIILAAWGDDDSQWVGRGMTLYCDPDVKWAGKAVGGISINQLSHIPKPMECNLNITRGKKKLYKIGVLK